MRMTLLLNASFEPLKVIPWQRAMVLLALEKVSLVAEHDSQEIRTVSLTIKMPAIVRLNKYLRWQEHPIRFSRHNIYARDGYRCQYCHEFFDENQLTLDHVRPRSRGGKTTWLNIVACCFTCNHQKRDRTPKEAGLTLFQKPTKPRSMGQLTMRMRFQNPPESWKLYLE